MMSKLLLVMFLGLQAHFAASYLVPLDKQAQVEFGGLLRWFWPWSYGDSGLPGPITAGQDLPTTGLFLALTAATVFGLAALATVGLWVPSTWWPALAAIGAVLLVCLTALFFGPTKLIPMAFALGTLYVVLAKPAVVGIG
jgi:hypothetical protein